MRKESGVGKRENKKKLSKIKNKKNCQMRKESGVGMRENKWEIEVGEEIQVWYVFVCVCVCVCVCTFRPSHCFDMTYTMRP